MAAARLGTQSSLFGGRAASRTGAPLCDSIAQDEIPASIIIASHIRAALKAKKTLGFR